MWPLLNPSLAESRGTFKHVSAKWYAFSAEMTNEFNE